jgi:hypothetical protein
MAARKRAVCPTASAPAVSGGVGTWGYSWYMGFFMAEKAYHVIAFATLHSGSRNKALTSHRGEKTVKGAREQKNFFLVDNSGLERKTV